MHGVISVWLRHFRVFRKHLLVVFFWAAIEPTLYLFAIGYGLGQFVGVVDGVSYFNFFLPATICNTAMMTALYESTYSSYYRLSIQNTFQSVMLSPVSPFEMAVGELVWAASKAFVGVLTISFSSIYFVGLEGFSKLVITWPIVMLISLLFAGFGLLLTSFMRSFESFTFALSGVAIPMTLFSGTYFPLDALPSWAQKLAQLSPLTHGVLSVRAVFLSRFEQLEVWRIVLLGVLVLVVGFIASKSIERRLTE